MRLNIVLLLCGLLLTHPLFADWEQWLDPDYDADSRTVSRSLTGYHAAQLLWLDVPPEDAMALRGDGRLIGQYLMDNRHKLELHLKYYAFGVDPASARPWLEAERIQDRASRLGNSLYQSSEGVARVELDVLYHQWEVGKHRWTLGRQVVTFGLGRIWSPVDMLAPYSRFDLERLYKSGVDGVRYDHFFNTATSAASVLTFSQQSDQSQRVHVWQTLQHNFAAGKWLVSAADRSEQRLLTISYQQNNVWQGGDFYIEWFGGQLSAAEQAIWSEQHHQRWLLGYSFKAGRHSIVTVEGFWQSLAASSVDDYPDRIARQAVSQLPDMGLAPSYLAFSVHHQWSALTTLESLVMLNIQDRSSYWAALLRYSATEALEWRLGAGIGLRGRQRQAEFSLMPNNIQLGIYYYF